MMEQREMRHLISTAYNCCQEERSPVLKAIATCKELNKVNGLAEGW